jgi:iodotyrosine deiodinase
MLQRYVATASGRRQVLHPEQSVGISCGLFLAACTHVGLITLANPPRGNAKVQLCLLQIVELLGRPINEEAFLVLCVGYAAKDAFVPNFLRKPVEAILVHL